MLVYLFIVFFSILFFYYLNGLVFKKKVIEGNQNYVDDPNVSPFNKVNRTINDLIDDVNKLITFGPSSIISIFNPKNLIEGLTSEQQSGYNLAENDSSIKNLTNQVNNIQDTVNQLMPIVEQNTKDVKSMIKTLESQNN